WHGTKEVPMPWRAASPMDQRTQFIADFLRDALSIMELCALYDVSRKTGYKWIDRYLRHGPAGLEELASAAAFAESDARGDRGRDPRRSAAAPDVGRQEAAGPAAQAPFEVATARPVDGVRHPEAPWDGAAAAPASTHRHPGRPTSQILAPNDVWSADYNGQFRTGDGRYCYPLTVAD